MTSTRNLLYKQHLHVTAKSESPFTSNSFDSTSASNSASSTPIHCVTPARGMKTRKFISEQDIMGTPQKSGCNAKYNASGQLIPRRILIAVDGSENSEMAFDWYMNNLRDDKRDVLVLLHVSNSSHSMPIHSGVDIPQRSFDAFNEARRSSSSQIVTDVVELYEDKAREAGLNSSGYELIHMNDGNTAKTICKYAKNNNIDHVIMGTRGFSKIRRKLLGSVSDYVLNNCIVSTTVVRQPHEDK
ncbi:universal stress protein YxiE-like isoform X2 [Symsagittifera roscoffensis]|uniref:universal stress protein YxiE-like isoform X2 n=1 Tax=Symsagittifera roscoffensis TaxID=84072 RepID=UPI00307C0063